jgi:hypothetical protein
LLFLPILFQINYGFEMIKIYSNPKLWPPNWWKGTNKKKLNYLSIKVDQNKCGKKYPFSSPYCLGNFKCNPPHCPSLLSHSIKFNEFLAYYFFSTTNPLKNKL